VQAGNVLGRDDGLRALDEAGDDVAVLVSGGLDSFLANMLFRDRQRREIFFTYGAKQESHEYSKWHLYGVGCIVDLPRLKIQDSDEIVGRNLLMQAMALSLYPKVKVIVSGIRYTGGYPDCTLNAQVQAAIALSVAAGRDITLACLGDMTRRQTFEILSQIGLLDQALDQTFTGYTDSSRILKKYYWGWGPEDGDFDKAQQDRRLAYCEFLLHKEGLLHYE